MIYLKLFLTAVFWAGLHCRAHSCPGGATLVGILPAVSRGLGVHDPLVWHFEGRLQPLRRSSSPCLPLGDDGCLSLQRLLSDGPADHHGQPRFRHRGFEPRVISLFAALLFRGERLTPVKIIGIALSVSGAST